MTVADAIKKLKDAKCPEETATKYLEKHPQKNLTLFVNGAIILHEAWNPPKAEMRSHETRSWYYCLVNALQYDKPHFLPKDISLERIAAPNNVSAGLGARPIPAIQPYSAHDHSRNKGV